VRPVEDSSFVGGGNGAIRNFVNRNDRYRFGGKIFTYLQFKQAAKVRPMFVEHTIDIYS